MISHIRKDVKYKVPKKIIAVLLCFWHFLTKIVETQCRNSFEFSNPDKISFPELQEGFTDTTTPWHSDEAYWLDLSDKRALSFWFPMQDVNVCINTTLQIFTVSLQSLAVLCVPM